jgi:hypothetical protein
MDSVRHLWARQDIQLEPHHKGEFGSENAIRN